MPVFILLFLQIVLYDQFFLCDFLFSDLGSILQSSIRTIISKYLMCITFSAKSYFIMYISSTKVWFEYQLRLDTFHKEEKLLQYIVYVTDKF